MKIQLEIPDNWKDEVIYLITEGELIAIKKPSENWLIKTSSCNKCGKCCYNISERNPFPRYTDGSCIYLRAEEVGSNKFVCHLGHHRPTACLLGFHEPREKPEFCTEEFK